ncbi:aldo/keto reductase [Ferrimonas balearica]|uniref:aldo/keto reductase n=1 Tax=Ferrimonas balearica TaxID=44012 RepID=UPI001C59F01E|nr:aldo/keto reductase family oxidoreductase [Ferrimonas balearica]MBW3138125.1 aldo/keto reductase family oxidoreductase [Ferrimonas balearica]MBW3164319.1 aldo/keto reductase family oxidoreductase [Ferrimonas balearica]MBY6225041.1 aldo/keto reductase family oxidoreductase [Ferrimonas balearica]
MLHAPTHPQGPVLSRFIAGYWRLLDWQMTPQQRLGFLQAHLDLGITSCDHADIYGDYQCEAAFGEALALNPGLRERIQLVTKCGICLPGSKGYDLPHYNTSAGHIQHQVEQSLRHFGTDYLDLLLIHRPDPLMQADEVAEAFNQLQQAGKVRHFGVSNFTPSQFDLLQSRLDQPLVTNQVEISPLQLTALHDGTLDHLQQHRIRPMAWSCLGGGRLFSPADPQARSVRLELSKVAEEVGAEGVDQVALAWLLALPSNPLPILGSGKIERLQQAVAAERLNLTREQWFRIWVASTGHNVP